MQLGMKPFSWSWSRLKNYRTCPKRHYEVDIAKNYVEEEGDALKWGHEVHDAMAKYIAKGKPLPETMQHYEQWPKNLRALAGPGIDVKVENKLAMSEKFGPTSFFDAGTWFRGVLDVLALIPAVKAAISVDWKTGAVKPEFEQLGLSAQLVFAHYPEIDEVGTIYVWLGHNTQTVKVYKRDGMSQLWGDLQPEINKMSNAHKMVEYPPTPSGICLKHCPVTGCPYHGKGTR